MRRAMLSLVCLLAGCANAGTTVPPTIVPVASVLPSGPDAPSSESAPSDTPDVRSSCNLTATLRDGGTSAYPRFTMTLKNEGSKPLRLVLPGDGSEVGWRTPSVKWTATDHGAEVAAVSTGRCGNVNPVLAEEIVTLEPGASRDLTGWLPDPSFPSGTYDLRLTYRNDPSPDRKARFESEEVKHLVAGSSTCEVTTRPLRVTLP